MNCKVLIRSLQVVILAIMLLPGMSGAEELQCPSLDEAVAGEGKKYSVCSMVDGPEYFADIRCAMIRRTDLCAMEMSAFDIYGRVFDYYSGAEIVITAAIYVVTDEGVLAFVEQNDAERFIGEQGAGKRISYEQLTAMKFE